MRIAELYRSHNCDLQVLSHVLNVELDHTIRTIGSLESLTCSSPTCASHRITVPHTDERIEAMEFAAWYFIICFLPHIEQASDWRSLPDDIVKSIYEFVAIFAAPYLDDGNLTELYRFFGRNFRQSAEIRFERYEEFHW